VGSEMCIRLSNSPETTNPPLNRVRTLRPP
jgi:hypothetical protein